MKKLASLTIALGLMTSIAATASADTVTGTTTSPGSVSAPAESVVTATATIQTTPQIILTQKTAFYLATGNTIPVGWLSAQTLDTTGEVITDGNGNEWREIYTWLGKAWLKIPTTANVIEP